MKRALTITLLGMALAAGASLGPARAQEAPGLGVGLWVEKSVLRIDEPLKLTITVENLSGAELFPPAGTGDRRFDLALLFTGPHGEGISADVWDVNVDQTPPPPPVVYLEGEPLQVEAIETLEAGWTLTVTVDDAHAIYPLRAAGTGHYSVKAVVPFRRYAGPDIVEGSKRYAKLENVRWQGAVESPAAEFTLVDDADLDGFSGPVALSPPWLGLADCDDGDAAVHPGVTEVPGNSKDDDCDPATLDAPPAPAVVPGTLGVLANLHTVGTGSHPGSTKTPLTIPVRVYEKGPGTCAGRFGTSWQNYKSIWLSCTVPSAQVGTTGADGTTSFSLPPGDYILIGESAGAAGDEATYLGVSVGAVASGEAVQKYLQLIAKADGRRVAGKTTVRTGSLLLIIEPEYVEWDGAQELYPFIFESVGEWGVVTSVTPPEGFEADTPELSAVVSDEMESLQFTITDVGSEWVSTGVTHKIKHKGKSETIRSKIGVKLSKRLAEQKGIGRHGTERGMDRQGKEKRR